MRKKKPEFIPATVSREPTLELKPIPAPVSCEPAVEPKFLPPVTLSYESTLELKTIAAGEGTATRTTKAVRPVRAKKAKQKGA
jgi:hypothetical protein